MRRALPAGLLAAAIVAANVTLWFGRPVPESSEANGVLAVPELAGLRRAVADARPIEPRLTWIVGHAPYRPRMPLEARRTSSLALAAAQIELRTRDHPDPAALEALAAARLLSGDADAAVRLLQRLGADRPDDPRILSDLAAALLVRASRTGAGEDAVRALDAAAAAARLAPKLPAARFNLALALEAVSLDAEAIDAWQDYLAVETRGPWAQEARRHQRSLRRRAQDSWERQAEMLDASPSHAQEQTIIDANPQVVREYLEETLLPRWAQAVLARDADAAAPLLRRARRLAAGIAVRQGQSALPDALTPLDRNDTCAATLAQAHLEFAAARAAYLRSAFADAQRGFETAHQRFADCGSSYVRWTTLYLAVVPYFRQETAQALQALDAVIAAPDARGDLNVLGRAHWTRAIIYTGRAEPVRARDEYLRALPLFERTGESEGLAMVPNIIVEPLRDLGELRESWRHQARAWSVSSRIRPVRRHAILYISAMAASDEHLPHAALQFEHALVKSALKGGSPMLAAEAYQRRMVTLQQLGEEARARDDLEEARRWIARIPDEAVRARTRAELDGLMGTLWSGTSPAEAHAAFDRALAFFDGHRWARRIPGLLLGRARASRAMGNATAAERDLMRAIDIFEAERPKLRDERIRASFFDEAWRLFEEIVSLEFEERGDPDRALAYAERARARTLADALSGPRAPAMATAAAAFGADDPATAGLFYVQLRDRVLLWVLRAGRTQVIERRIERTALESLVTRFRESLEAAEDDAAIAREAEALFELLVRPAIGTLTGCERLVVFPHGALHRVPFAALRDHASGRYLIEDRVIGYSPSLTVYVRARGAMEDWSIGSSISRRSPSILSIGDPVPDEPSFEGAASRDAASGGAPSRRYPRLPATSVEAHAIRAFYADGEVMVGAGATRGAILDKLDRYEVVHFAGHAVINPLVPHLSRLLVTPDARGQSSSITVADLSGRAFAHATLVVLAACRTADGEPSAGEGVLSLSRPFLAGGVPVVVGTLWDVDDRISARIFTAFHHEVAQGTEPWSALRAAQLQVLASTDPIDRSPATWAPYVAMGAAPPRAAARQLTQRHPNGATP